MPLRDPRRPPAAVPAMTFIERFLAQQAARAAAPPREDDAGP